MLVHIEINDDEYNETKVISDVKLFENWWIPSQIHGVTILPYPVQMSSWESSYLISPLYPIEGKFYVALKSSRDITLGYIDFNELDYGNYIRKTYVRNHDEERTTYEYRPVLYSPEPQEFQEKWPNFSRCMLDGDPMDPEFREMLARNELQYSES